MQTLVIKKYIKKKQSKLLPIRAPHQQTQHHSLNNKVEHLCNKNLADNHCCRLKSFINQTKRKKKKKRKEKKKEIKEKEIKKRRTIKIK
jgi:hypothetical protein